MTNSGTHSHETPTGVHPRNPNRVMIIKSAEISVFWVSKNRPKFLKLIFIPLRYLLDTKNFVSISKYVHIMLILNNQIDYSTSVDKNTSFMNIHIVVIFVVISSNCG